MAIEGPNSSFNVASLIFLMDPATFAPMLSPLETTIGLRLDLIPVEVPPVGNAIVRATDFLFPVPNILEKFGNPILIRDDDCTLYGLLAI